MPQGKSLEGSRMSAKQRSAVCLFYVCTSQGLTLWHTCLPDRQKVACWPVACRTAMSLALARWLCVALFMVMASAVCCSLHEFAVAAS